MKVVSVSIQKPAKIAHAVTAGDAKTSLVELVMRRSAIRIHLPAPVFSAQMALESCIKELESLRFPDVA